MTALLAPAEFVRGLELFNEGEYYECHEVIEHLWLHTEKDHPHRDLYKAVIQVAAAIYQRQRGIRSGALGLYESSMRYLSAYQPSCLGVDVQGLMQATENYFKEYLSKQDGFDKPLKNEAIVRVEYSCIKG